MISWIVASHDPKILEANLLRTLKVLPGEELLVEDQPSIAKAYNRAGGRAVNPLRVYVHHDVRILDPVTLRAELMKLCTRPMVGMAGVAGSTGAAWPWWQAPELCGSVLDTRLGRLDFSRGDQPAAILDGCLLATYQEITWDEGYTGFHGYDHDISLSQIAAGRVNWCMPHGDALVLHNRVTDTSPTNTDMIAGWAEAEARFRRKWSSI